MDEANLRYDREKVLNAENRAIITQAKLLVANEIDDQLYDLDERYDENFDKKFDAYLNDEAYVPSDARQKF